MSRDPKEYLSKDRLMRPIGAGAAVAQGVAVEPVSAVAAAVPKLTPMTEVMPAEAETIKRTVKEMNPFLKSQSSHPEAADVALEAFAPEAFAVEAVVRDSGTPSTSTKTATQRTLVVVMTTVWVDEDAAVGAECDREASAAVDFEVDVAASVAFEAVSVHEAVAA